MLRNGCVIGVVHLLPLPGSPRFGGSMRDVVARAVSDARAYARGGVDALVVENYGDTPFLKSGLAPETVAALARCAARVREEFEGPLGINALRNDAQAALGIAAAVEAEFVRINVHAGVVATDQGLIEGDAAATLRRRRALGTDTLILADVEVKHARPLFASDLVQAARDLVQRAGADGIIVSGVATGAPTEIEDLAQVRAALPDALLLAGSGVTRGNVGAVLAHADAVIVGTALERGGVTGAPVEVARVRSCVKAARAATPRDPPSR